MGIIRACTAMLPRLRAEESILATERVGVGMGALGNAGADIMKTWQREIASEKDVAVPARPPRTVASMRALGIKVHGATVA